MRRLVQAKILCATQAPVHLDAGNEIFGTEVALVGRGFESQWSTCSDGIAELPGVAGRKILSGERIKANRNKERTDPVTIGRFLIPRPQTAAAPVIRTAPPLRPDPTG